MTQKEIIIGWQENKIKTHHRSISKEYGAKRVKRKTGINFVFVFYHCHNRVPQTWLLKNKMKHTQKHINVLFYSSGGQRYNIEVSTGLCSFWRLLKRIRLLAFPAASGLSAFLGLWPLPPFSKPTMVHVSLTSAREVFLLLRIHVIGLDPFGSSRIVSHLTVWRLKHNQQSPFCQLGSHAHRFQRFDSVPLRALYSAYRTHKQALGKMKSGKHRYCLTLAVQGRGPGEDGGRHEGTWARWTRLVRAKMGQSRRASMLCGTWTKANC